MNEVAQPLIFPKGELEERYRFRKLLEQMIILDAPENVFDHLDARTLRDIFEIENKGTTLNAAAVSNLLYAGGFTKHETGSYAEVRGDVNLAAFKGLTMESKQLLSHRLLENNPRAHTCRKLIMAEKHGQEVTIDDDNNSVVVGNDIDWINTWLQCFTISPYNENQAMIGGIKWKAETRSSLVVLHLYYCNVMQYYDKKAVNRKQFKHYLEKLGVVFKKGYAQKTSGVIYADKVWIPTTIEDQQRSIELGYATITENVNTVYTPFGKRPIASLLDQKDRIYRRLGYVEPKETPLETVPSKIARETAIPRRKTEVREDVTIQAEERIEITTEDLVGYSNGNEPEIEEVKIQDTDDTYTESETQYTETIDDERTSEDTAAETSQSNDEAAESETDDPIEDDDAEVEFVKPKSTRSKPKAFIDYDPLDTAASAAFLNSKPDDENGKDREDDGEDIITIETIVTALKVANNIQPITIDSLNYWLDKMQTSLAELNMTAEELITLVNA